MTDIWRYVLATDCGMAPCSDNGLLTLSTCKPKIRLYAKVGDWVVAYAPKRYGRGRVSYAGQIARILTLGDYQIEFPDRSDAVYRRSGYHSDGREEFECLCPSYHEGDDDKGRDWRGRNTVIFDPFWYFGGQLVEAPPELADMAHYYVGQSKRDSTPQRLDALKIWLEKLGPPGVRAEPREPKPVRPTTGRDKSKTPCGCG